MTQEQEPSATSPTPSKGQVDWVWVRTQWEAGSSYTQISAAYEAATGERLPESSIKTRNRRESWRRVGQPEQPIVHEGIIIPAQSSLASRAPELVLAELELSKRTQAHHEWRNKVVDAATNLIEGSLETLRALRRDGNTADSKDLKAIGDAMARAADMLGNAEDRERKARGLDRPEANPNNRPQGVTQILINVQAPPLIPHAVLD